MIDIGDGFRASMRRCNVVRCALTLTLASTLLGFTAPDAKAQSYGNFNVRGPNINVGPRISVNPNVRYSPNIEYDGYDGSGPRPRNFRNETSQELRDPPPRQVRKAVPVVADGSYVIKEVLIEVEGTPTEAQVDGLARRHRLTRVQSQNFPLTNSTFFRWRISDERSVDTVVRQLVQSGDVKSAQRNNIFKLQQNAAAPSPAAQASGEPAQYELAKMRLPQAHALSVGANVTIAVIDSGIDTSHPELAGVIAGSFDALASKEGPHPHGTGIASAIAAHAKLTGAAPSSRLLAIRAFGAQTSGAESTSFVILKSLDYAVANRAQIINMSFAGPPDVAMSRALTSAAAKGIVLIAAAGNTGPKSKQLYPAADRNVIAVTATDQSDRLFAESNRGGFVAISAPGVDILSAAPDGKYQVSSGTSLSAAFISGIAALMIARNPDIAAADIRAALLATARDLGPSGRDDQFGAGQVDALSAVSAVATPVAAASDRPAARQ